MGVMNKLRENTGVVLWILVLAFGVIWVLQDAGTFDVVGATGNTIIEVDGDQILYEDYAAELERRMEAYRQRSGETMTPQMIEAERERVFNALVEDRLREREIARLGITVSDEEVYDLVMGDDPHPVIKMYFGDGQGGVDRALLQSFIENPDASQDWVALEEYMRSERRREKLENLIAATVRVTDQDVADEYARRNKSVSARYVALRYAALPDDSVEVTDRDLRAYYDEHRADYERERTYELSYATLSKAPSPGDSSAIMQDLGSLKSRFQTAEDDSTFLARNASERPYTDAYFRRDELEPQLADAVFADLEAGQVVGPVFVGNEVHLVKVKDVRPAEEEAVRASHILVRAPEGDAAARQQARETLNDVKQQIQQGADFAALARQVSQDGTAQRGGDLGWFGPGRMVEPFEDAAFGAREGEIVGPVETQFGVHLIKVTGRADQEVQLSDYVQTVRASTATLTDAEERLEDVQYYASDSGDFASEAERLNLDVQTVTVQAEQDVIPGLGRSVAIRNFLDDADEGDISRVIELDDRFVVVHVDAITPEGFRPFDEVRDEVEPRARLQRKAEIQQQRLQRALEAGSFDQLATAVGTQTRQAAGLRLSNPVVPGLGREPQFVGTAFGLASGQTSRVVEGENAAYVIQVTEVNEPAPLSDQQREQIREQLLNQRRSRVVSQWLTDLRESADVQDYRRRFYQ